MSETVLVGKDAGLTPLTVLHSPGGSSNCHAVQLTERATGGGAGTLSLVSYNSSAGALQVRSTGPYMQAYDGSNTLKFEVTNAGNVTAAGTIAVTGATTLSSTLAVTGAVTLSSTLAVTGNVTASGNVAVTGTLAVASTSAFTGAVTLTGGVTGATTITGDLTLQGTNKAYRFRRSGSALDLDATGVDLLISNFSGTNFDGTQRSYLRLSADAQNTQVAGKVEFVDSLYGATRHVLDGAANTLGFHGATPVAKQTVSGSRGGNAALADLITKLATLGLVTDGTSA